jgi:hypothetical protein
MMLNHWHVDRPNLLISVTGGAVNFTMTPRLTEVFRNGFIKAATSTGWSSSCVRAGVELNLALEESCLRSWNFVLIAAAERTQKEKS